MASEFFVVGMSEGEYSDYSAALLSVCDSPQMAQLRAVEHHKLYLHWLLDNALHQQYEANVKTLSWDKDSWTDYVANAGRDYNSRYYEITKMQLNELRQLDKEDDD
jgi:hypothetical protein